MEIYVGNLAANVTEKELRNFFKGFEKKAAFKIQKLISKEGSLYYAKVDIDSDKVASKAIRKLHCRKLHGRPAIVREFQYRAGNNDRRALNWRTQPWIQLERRLDERRKRFKLANRRDPEYSAYDNLATKGF